MPVHELLEAIRPVLGDVDGVTLTGGEPFDQPAALLALLDALRRLEPELDLLAFSGYPAQRLRRRHPDVLERLDAIVAGPYRADLPGELVWRASGNQELVLLSELGHRRYADHLERRTTRPKVQVVVDDGVSIIGIPRAGDLERVEQLLRERGVRLRDATWRT